MEKRKREELIGKDRETQKDNLLQQERMIKADSKIDIRDITQECKKRQTHLQRE